MKVVDKEAGERMRVDCLKIAWGTAGETAGVLNAGMGLGFG